MARRALKEQALLEPNAADGALEDAGASGRTIAFLRQAARDLGIRETGRMQRQGLGGEGTRARQTLQAADGNRDVKGGGVATPPDNARAHAIGDRAMEDDLVDETAHQGLFLRPG